MLFRRQGTPMLARAYGESASRENRRSHAHICHRDRVENSRHNTAMEDTLACILQAHTSSVQRYKSIPPHPRVAPSRQEQLFFGGICDRLSSFHCTFIFCTSFHLVAPHLVSRPAPEIGLARSLQTVGADLLPSQTFAITRLRGDSSTFCIFGCRPAETNTAGRVSKRTQKIRRPNATQPSQVQPSPAQQAD